jgi:hypothetical protein
MSQLTSTASIDLPAIFSAGQFETDCATRYNLNHWSDETIEDEWTLDVECIPGQVFTFHGDQLRAPGFSTTEDKVAFALRHVCHFLIDQIDNRGLEEVCRSLSEFFAYYKPAEQSAQLPYSQRKRVLTCSRYISPAFVIGEEE